MGVITPKGVCATVVAVGFVFVVAAIFLGLDLKPNQRGIYDAMKTIGNGINNDDTLNYKCAIAHYK